MKKIQECIDMKDLFKINTLFFNYSSRKILLLLLVVLNCFSLFAESATIPISMDTDIKDYTLLDNGKGNTYLLIKSETKILIYQSVNESEFIEYNPNISFISNNKNLEFYEILKPSSLPPVLVLLDNESGFLYLLTINSFGDLEVIFNTSISIHEGEIKDLFIAESEFNIFTFLYLQNGDFFNVVWNIDRNQFITDKIDITDDIILFQLETSSQVFNSSIAGIFVSKSENDYSIYSFKYKDKFSNQFIISNESLPENLISSRMATGTNILIYTTKNIISELIYDLSNIISYEKYSTIHDISSVLPLVLNNDHTIYAIREETFLRVYDFKIMNTVLFEDNILAMDSDLSFLPFSDTQLLVSYIKENEGNKSINGFFFNFKTNEISSASIFFKNVTSFKKLYIDIDSESPLLVTEQYNHGLNVKIYSLASKLSKCILFDEITFDSLSFIENKYRTDRYKLYFLNNSLLLFDYNLMKFHLFNDLLIPNSYKGNELYFLKTNNNETNLIKLYLE